MHVFVFVYNMFEQNVDTPSIISNNTCSYIYLFADLEEC